MAGKVSLEVLTGPLAGQTFEFQEHDTLVCGRRIDCHVRLLDNSKISRHHFLLEVNPPDARLRDLGSLNGTFVNEKKHGGRGRNDAPPLTEESLHPEIDLCDRDKIRVGRTSLRVRIFLPRECSACGGSLEGLPVDVEGASALCQSCTEKNEMAALGDRTATAGSCGHCGEDFSERRAGSRSGAYLCRSCLLDTKDSPVKVLGRLAAQDEKISVIDQGLAIAGYEVGERIGEGGYGAVYLATRQEDGMQAALKVLLARVAVDDRARGRFHKEIEFMRRLEHRNLMHLLDHGAVGSAFYFLMDYCEGGSLSDRMRRNGGRLTIADAVPLVLDALTGLEYAHRHGVVHRDIKPSNILLRRRLEGWQAVLSDLGLAKNFEEAGLSGLTVTGSFAGTHVYMPREQVINFKYVKPVSDVWSMGATLYRLLTGHTPREGRPGQSSMEVVLANRVTPIRERKEGIPAALAEVIDHSLARDPEDRFQDASEMRSALEAAL